MSDLSSKQAAIRNMTDIEEVKEIALKLLKLVWNVRGGADPKFEAQGLGGWGGEKEREWVSLADGTLDYCIGIADGSSSHWYATRVVRDNTMTVWPEDRWGEGVFEV